ncbi:dipeptidase [Pendulispora brunnea]|uniref:Dipeptidase n=1 Tax=Pendulispora brunnea TaxID=2905690 RepID=A0ABZ2JX58_9BACT
MSSNRFTRRDFSRLAAAVVLTGCAGSNANAQPSTSSATTPKKPRGRFDDAILIDALGTIGRDEWSPSKGDPLIAQDLNDAARSGITAINITVDDPTEDANVFDATTKTIATFQREIAAHPEVLAAVRNGAELRAAKTSRKLGIIFGFQGSAVLGPKLEHFDTFRGLGVRIMQLTYNVRTLLGDGCLEPGNAGLSILGRQAVERMNAARVLIDLSHCGQRTTADAIEASKGPVAITHTGCAALANRPRNKRDEEMKRCADKGGFVGIYFMPFLRMQGQSTSADVMAHLEHAIKVCGEDHVGIGTDGTTSPIDLTSEAYLREHRRWVEERIKKGIAAPGEAADIHFLCPDLNTPQRFQTLGEMLLARGHGEARVRKLLGGNFARIFGEVCG